MEKKPVHYITVPNDFAGQRIDNFLFTYFKEVPKTHIYRILRKGEIRVNKKRAKPTYRLQAEDNIRLPPMHVGGMINPGTPAPQLITNLSKRVLFEDERLLIMDKPAGLPVHAGHNVKWGLIETLRYMYPKLPQLELAHRLDADTSGCLIIAKKRSILRELHELLRAGTIRKVYWALTKGQWQEDELRVQTYLLKNQLSSGERIVRVASEGKYSVTQFRPLQGYPSCALVEANLETGRTHQIRVHAQHMGHPIAGDEKYGDRQFNKLMRDFGLKRLFLHAYFIDFTLPSTGLSVQVTAPLAQDLLACLKALE